MTPTEPVGGFRHGAGRLCLDFIRTLRHRGTPAATEELPSPAALAAWVTEFGSCRPDAAPPHDAAARDLREAIHALVIAALTPGGVTTAAPGARRTVNAAAAGPVPAPRLTADGTLVFDADDPVAATLALLARDALDLVGTADPGRIHRCANPECGALFYDGSRPGSRRWCSMSTCGNRAKKTTYRDRARA